MNIRVANAPVSWGIMEVEGWSPPLAPGTFLDELKSAGYEGTELGPYGYLPTDPKVLVSELQQRSLTLVSAFVPLRLKEPNADLEPVRQVGTLLNALGAGHLVLSDAMWPEREAIAGRVTENGIRLDDREWGIVADNVRMASKVSAEYGLRCVFHHHTGTYVETPAEIAKLMDLTDVGLCLDTGHYVYGGGDPVEAVETFGRRVEYLHFKDVNPERLEQARRNGLGFLDGVRHGVFCELGSGCVRFPELVERLSRIDYDGWATVEQDVDVGGTAARTPAESAAASRQYLRSALAI